MQWTLQDIKEYNDVTDSLVTANARMASEGYGFLQACWHAIRNDITELKSCFAGQQEYRILHHSLEREDPHNRLVFLAHLRCALAVAEHCSSGNHLRPFSTETIRSIAEEIEQEGQKERTQSEGTLSVAYVRDLIAILLAAKEAEKSGNDPAKLCQRHLCEAQKIERISVLLVMGANGYVGTLSLELVERNEEFSAQLPIRTLYPTPLLSLIARDEAFRRAESNARHCVLGEIRDGWPKNYDVRWDLHLQNGEPLSRVLMGDSLGGAFALGLLKLLSSGEP